MLTQIQIQNFGCFDNYDYKIKFNKLNVLVGTNNSGKSTIFKALNLTRNYSVQGGQMPWNTIYYQMTSFYSAVYGHDESRRMIINIDYQHEDSDYVSRFIVEQGSPIQQDVLANGGRIGSIVNNFRYQNIAKTIWYFSSNRIPIGFSTDVGVQHDVLQPLSPSGSDVIQFLIEKWTSRDPNYEKAQEWIKKIDPQASLLKTPLVLRQASIETDRNDGKNNISVNLSLQGNGIQNALTIIAGVIFSPKGSTIIIEEPENYLNSRSIEVLVDLFNYAVNELGKQIIITTHSWEIINAYCSDIGEGTPRGTSNHIKAKPEDFKLIIFNEKVGENKIQEYDLRGKKYDAVRKYFKDLWG